MWRWAITGMLLAACGSPSGPALPDDEVLWPEADALFHQDPRWLGGDAAFSVDLGGERTLWLFGDTFVGRSVGSDRTDAVMVRNTVGVMTGRDPSAATMDFAWREGDGPEAFFASDGDGFFWPGHGVRTDAGLTLFLQRVVLTDDDALGFRADGWLAVRVDDPDAPPSEWSPRPLPGFELPEPIVMGVAVLRFEGHVYAYAVHEPGSHDVYVARWPEAELMTGPPAWYSGGAWIAHDALDGMPSPIIEDAQTELSVHRLDDGRFVEVQSLGFGDTTIGIRTAPRPEGPWSDAASVFRPPESRGDRPFVYAGKAHGELEGAPLIVTYADNAWDFGDLVRDEELYFPHFLRLPAP